MTQARLALMGAVTQRRLPGALFRLSGGPAFAQQRSPDDSPVMMEQCCSDLDEAERQPG